MNSRPAAELALAPARAACPPSSRRRPGGLASLARALLDLAFVAGACALVAGGLHAQNPATTPPPTPTTEPQTAPLPVPATAPEKPGAEPAQDPAAKPSPVAPTDDARPGADTPVGPPAETKRLDTPTVVSIVVKGQKRYRATQLIDALGQKIGAPYDPLAVTRGLENLFKSLRVRATVNAREVPGGLEFELDVTEMPVDLEPRFVGNAEVTAETLRKWAQLTDRGELYLYQADRVRQRLLEGYRQDGYYFVEVDVRKRGDDPESDALADVIFEIREGPQVRVKDVLVRGNHSLPDVGMWFWRDGLTKLAKTELEGPSLFNWWGAKFDEEKLQADLLAMRNVYRDKGWLDAVVEVEFLDFSASPDRSKVVIHVVVDEGKPWTISALSIRAFQHETDPKKPDAFVDTPVDLVYTEAELLALCKLKAGKRYELAQQKADQAALRKRYGHDGYLAHPSLGNSGWQFLDPDLVYDFDHHTIAVTYRIAQGEQRYVREVMFEGAEYTRDRVLRREVDVMPGERADIEKITRSLNQLYSTNYFNDEYSPLDHKDPTYTFKPVEGQPSLVDVLYQVEEGRVVDFQIQGGVDSNNGVFGRISLRMRNFDGASLPSSLWRTPAEIYDKEAFHGAGQLLDLNLSPGTVVNSYGIRFQEPDLFRTHFDRVILDLELNRRLRRYRFYDEERNERVIKFGREFGRNFTVFAGFTNTGLDVTKIQSSLSGFADPTGFPLADSLFEEEGHSNLIGATLDFNYRQLDRTLNPTEGFKAVWRNGLYGGLFAGDYEMIKSEVDFDWYWPIGPDDLDVRPGFHLALGAGVADEYGSTTVVPYTERFQQGGSRSLRGFAYHGVGPNKGGEPLGGQTEFAASLEYKIPLYKVTQPGTYKEIEVFHAKLFADMGVLDPLPWQLDPNEVRASIGFGVGMSYPIPIVLNFGFPLRSGEGDRRETFSFSIISITF